MRVWWIWGPAILALLLLLGLGGNTTWRLTGGALPRDPVEQRIAELTPDLRWSLPPGPGPFPALLLFSGCDGPQDNMDRWAAMARAEGWAALIVDSHGPRGLDWDPAWRLVCSGQALSGPERAGDVAAALEIARRDPRLAPPFAVMGASHGGWAVLEFLGFHGRRQRPDGLQAWPGGSARAATRGLGGAILLYPFCGPGAKVGRLGWRLDIPVQMALVVEDSVTPMGYCSRLAERMAAAGRDVSVREYERVTHGFDQQTRAPLSSLRFDQAATDQALADGAALLRQLAPPQTVGE